MAEFTTHELYSGEVKIRFYPNSHRYKLEGRRDYLISTTAVTGIVGGTKTNLLVNWAQNQYQKALLRWLETATEPIPKIEIEEAINQCRTASDEEKEKAAAIGTVVHDYAEAYGKAMRAGERAPDLPPVTSEQMFRGIEAFLSWVRDNDVKFLETERLVYSKKHDYVGTLDLIAWVNDKLTLVDYKTSKAVYDEYFYQTGGYTAAWEEEPGNAKIQQVMILHFDRDTGIVQEHYIPLKDCRHYERMFRHLLAIKKDLKKKAKKH